MRTRTCGKTMINNKIRKIHTYIHFYLYKCIHVRISCFVKFEEIVSSILVLYMYTFLLFFISNVKNCIKTNKIYLYYIPTSATVGLTAFLFLTNSYLKHWWKWSLIWTQYTIFWTRYWCVSTMQRNITTYSCWFHTHSFFIPTSICYDRNMKISHHYIPIRIMMKKIHLMLCSLFCLKWWLEP